VTGTLTELADRMKVGPRMGTKTSSEDEQTRRCRVNSARHSVERLLWDLDKPIRRLPMKRSMAARPSLVVCGDTLLTRLPAKGKWQKLAK